MALFLAAGASARAGTIGYGQCGTYDAYLLLYKSTERLEELGKLRCGEKLEILGRSPGYSQVRTLDGKIGWVRDADLSEAPPAPQREYTFGLSGEPEQPKPSKAAAPESAAAPANSLLTNESILLMRGMRRSQEFILERVRTSRCAFDTSPVEIQKLHAAGISDKIILAMLETMAAPETPAAGAAESARLKIPDGIGINVELAGDVSAEALEEGGIIKMSAAEDLVVDGVPIIVRGSPARARVLGVKLPGAHGGSGEVAWFMQDVVALGGERLPVTFADKQPGKNHTRIFDGYAFFLTTFHKGSPAIRASDSQFRAIVHGDKVLSVPQSVAANRPAGQTPAAPAAQANAQSLQQVSGHAAVLPETAPPSEPSPEKPETP